MTETYELERGVIGGLMLHPEECGAAARPLAPENFSVPEYAAIFQTFRQAERDGKDPAGEVLKLEAPAVRSAILDSANSFLSMASYGGFVAALREADKKRRLLAELQSLVYSGPDTAFALSELDRIRNAFQPDEGGAQDAQKDFLSNYLENIYKPYDAGERVMTGFPKIDEATGGLMKGTMSLVGAPPSTGKTAFACNVAERQLKDGKKVAFFSLEMSKGQIMDRMMASTLQIPYARIQRRQLEKRETDAMAQMIGRLYDGGRLFLYDEVYSVEDIASRVYAAKPDVAIVDYVQCVRTAQRYGTSRESINHVSAELKHLAKSSRCHMMLLSQVARSFDAKSKEPKPPRMSDLKESGNLEADGDYIFMLYRPYVYDKARYSPEEASVLMDKNKYGNAGLVKLYFRAGYQKFEELEEKHADG